MPTSPLGLHDLNKIRQKLDENWGVQYNSQKIFLSDLSRLTLKAQQSFSPVTPQNDQPIKFVKKKSVDQSVYEDYERAMPSA